MDQARDLLQRAIAMRYRRGQDKAPRIVAKGTGRTAERILELARQHHIPIQQDKDLIRALSLLDLNREIPPALYRAVAEILAFVYRLNESTAGTALDRRCTSP